MIPLTLRRHSEKPLQKCHPKKPSDKTITHSAQGRLATHSHLATHLAGQRMSSYYKSDLRCASPSAYESGIFELLGQLYPARFLFFAVEKKEVAARRRHRRSQRIKGNKRRLRTKRLKRATHDLYGTPVPHSSLMGGRIRKNKNQMGITSPLPVAGIRFKTTSKSILPIKYPCDLSAIIFWRVQISQNSLVVNRYFQRVLRVAAHNWLEALIARQA